MFCFWTKLILHNSQFYSSFWGLKKKKKSSHSRLTGYLLSEMLLCVKSWFHREPDVTAEAPVLQSHFLQKRVWGTCQGLDTVLSTGWDNCWWDTCSISQNPEYRHEADTWEVPSYHWHKKKGIKVRVTAQRSHILERCDPRSFPNQHLLGVVVHLNCILKDKNVTRQGAWDLWS